MTERGFSSVVPLPDRWFIACRSRELRDVPLRTTFEGRPLVLFRDREGRPGALVDRCPHRNVPLSAGKVVDGCLQCPYHGWRFRPDGECAFVPGRVEEKRAPPATAYPCMEREGDVWIYSTPGASPSGEPFAFPFVDDPRYTTVKREITFEGSMHSVIENTLDVPHTAYLHGGLFRTEKRSNEIDVVVRRAKDRVEVEYIGEPRPSGIAGRILAPGGGIVRHYDRFIAPAVAQVEYALGETSHFVVTTAHTPLEAFKTRLYVSITFRLPIPHWLVKLFTTPVAMRIMKQDARIVRMQRDNLALFGRDQYASTELDAFGQDILRIWREGAADEAERRFKMRI